MTVFNGARRWIVIVSALLIAKGSLAQTAATASDSLIGKCVEIQPAKGALFPRWKAPRFARLEAAQYRDVPNAHRMRVATFFGTALDSAVRRYEREASWRVNADSIRLAFSTGFTLLNFAFALSGRDTLQGMAWVWNDDGPSTYFGGYATLSFPPCSRLYVP